MILHRINRLLAKLPAEIPLLAVRIFPAAVFWASGRTKVDGLSIKASTFALFEDIYAIPLVPPHLAAIMASVAEHLFPILLVLGLATRLSALALLGIGFRRLSITPVAVGPIKELVRKVDLAEITAAMNGWLSSPPVSMRAELSAWAEARGIEFD